MAVMLDPESYGAAYFADKIETVDAETVLRGERAVRDYLMERIPKREYDAALEPLRQRLLALRGKHCTLLEPSAADGSLPGHASGSASIVGLAGPRVVLDARSDGERGLLVLNLALLPGWKAFVDDQPAPIRRVNLGFMGVEVPRGEHLVWFIYWPWVNTVAASASLAFLIVQLVMS